MELWCAVLGVLALCAFTLTGNVFFGIAGIALVLIWFVNRGPGGP